MYMMTGNPMFALMGNGMSSNTMLMLYMMGAFGNSAGVTQTSMNSTSMLPLLLLAGNKRRSYRRRSNRRQSVVVYRR